jgi:hypothetical protein
VIIMLTVRINHLKGFIGQCHVILSVAGPS